MTSSNACASIDDGFLRLRSASVSFARGSLAAGRCPLGCMAGSSASCEDGVKDLLVIAVVVPPRELVEIERQVVLADFVVRADDAALQERPEGIEVRRVHVAAHVLAVGMVHALVPGVGAVVHE